MSKNTMPRQTRQALMDIHTASSSSHRVVQQRLKDCESADSVDKLRDAVLAMGKELLSALSVNKDMATFLMADSYECKSLLDAAAAQVPSATKSQRDNSTTVTGLPAHGTAVARSAASPSTFTSSASLSKNTMFSRSRKKKKEPIQPINDINNKHSRDDLITFVEETHTYSIMGSSDGVNSVTALLSEFFSKFDPDGILDMYYDRWQQNPLKKKEHYGKSKEDIKKKWKDDGEIASKLGTRLHTAIESYYLNKEFEHDKSCTEWKHFVAFQKQQNLKPYRIEWRIWSSEHKLAGTIDMLVKNVDGTFSIYDWKRSKHKICKNEVHWNRYGKGPLANIKDIRYYKYALQLNLYRTLLECYYECKVSSMYTVRLHPNAKSFELVQMDIMEEETKGVLDARLHEVASDIKIIDDLQILLNNVL